MKLSEYVNQAHGLQTVVANAVGCQPQLVWQWARGVRAVPIERCVDIERATNAVVRRWDLRPDDWHRIWPELIGTADAPELRQERVT